jgi:hypothetical protein
MTTRKNDKAVALTDDPENDEAVKDEPFTTFIPAVDFTGYPQPYKTNRKGVEFKKGIESPAVPESFAQLMRDKGLVADKDTTTADAGE